MPSDLNAVVLKLPMSGVAAVSAGSTVAKLRAAVLAYNFWSPKERQAVLSVMNALGSLCGTTARAVIGFINEYERALLERGIDPGFF
jgi:hypothetical protein